MVIINYGNKTPFSPERGKLPANGEDYDVIAGCKSCSVKNEYGELMHKLEALIEGRIRGCDDE